MHFIKTSVKRALYFNRYLHQEVGTKTSSQTQILSKDDTLYEIHFHSIKPAYVKDYMELLKEFNAKIHERRTGAELVGSWSVALGEVDNTIHLWKFSNGYTTAKNFYDLYRTDPDISEIWRKRNEFVRKRRSDFILKFNFWPEMRPRVGKSIYELRTYRLHPGKLLEWGKIWSEGIKCRGRDNEAVGGFFTHIGEMHVVYHLWAYKDFEHRHQVRARSWSRQEWVDSVEKSAPLVQRLRSQILVPTFFSPLQ